MRVFASVFEGSLEFSEFIFKFFSKSFFVAPIGANNGGVSRWAESDEALELAGRDFEAAAAEPCEERFGGERSG